MQLDYLSLFYGFIGGVAMVLLFQRNFTLVRKNPGYLKFFLPNMNNGYIELPPEMLDRIMPPTMPIPMPRPKGDKPKDDTFGVNSYL